ncbi:hypothetical protein ACFL3Q_14555 [Planctomycetota bacterium]
MKKNNTEAPEKPRDLVYILAPSYTGLTLLTFLLSRHADIATIGELKATARGDIAICRCSCGLLQHECTFWKRVTQEMAKAGDPFALEDFGTHFQADSFVCNCLLLAGVRGIVFEAMRNSMLRLSPHCRVRLHDILEQNRQVIDVICNLQKCRVFLDGSKEPIRLKLLYLANCWDLKVIYLIRDGRGATNSYMCHYNVSMETAARE